MIFLAHPPIGAIAPPPPPFFGFSLPFPLTLMHSLSPPIYPNLSPSLCAPSVFAPSPLASRPLTVPAGRPRPVLPLLVVQLDRQLLRRPTLPAPPRRPLLTRRPARPPLGAEGRGQGILRLHPRVCRVGHVGLERVAAEVWKWLGVRQGRG